MVSQLRAPNVLSRWQLTGRPANWSTDLTVNRRLTTRARQASWQWYLLTALAKKIHTLAAVLWRCWLAGRNGIRPVKIWVVGCWSGYLSGARFRLLRALVMSPGMLRRDISRRFIIYYYYYYLHTAQLMPLPLTVSLSLASVKSTSVVPEKGPLNGCVSQENTAISRGHVSALYVLNWSVTLIFCKCMGHTTARKVKWKSRSQVRVSEVRAISSVLSNAVRLTSTEGSILVSVNFKHNANSYISTVHEYHKITEYSWTLLNATCCPQTYPNWPYKLYWKWQENGIKWISLVAPKLSISKHPTTTILEPLYRTTRLSWHRSKKTKEFW